MTILNDKIIFSNISDYDLNETFLCGQCFRWDKYENGFKGFIYDTLCYVYFENEDLVVKTLSKPLDMDSFAKKAEDYLAINVNYKELKEKFSEDEIMKKAISYAPGIRVLNQEFFENLLTFIISQNNNIPRIKKIVDALSEKYGEKVGDTYRFPTPLELKDVTEKDYFDLKVGFRAKYLYDAVGKINSGQIKKEVIDTKSYAQAKEYLLQIKGVGPKVADCVLLFSCKKYESFPKDVWINRALEKLFDNKLPQCIKGYEGIAQQYIFHYIRNNLEK